MQCAQQQVHSMHDASLPVPPQSVQSPPFSVSSSDVEGKPLVPPPRIRAAAAQMVFASRTSQDFITPEMVAEIEAWSGRAVLEALASFEIPAEVSRATCSCVQYETPIIATAPRSWECMVFGLMLTSTG